MQRKNSGDNFWEKKIRQFEKELTREEKSSTTIRKYMHDVRQFCRWLSQNGAETGKITKELTIAYKQDLMDHYRISSVNSMLAPVNRFLRFCGMQQMCIKTCRTQRQYFRKEEELTKEEYLLLVETAERTGRIRLKLLMQTLACTGIRVQELTSVTVEHVREGKLEIYNKGKRRQVYLPRGRQWIDFWTNRVYEGGQTVTADAPLERIPVFVPSGSIVPLCAREIEYAALYADGDWEVRVFPGRDATFTVYQDAGDGYAYEQGERSSFQLIWNERKQTLTAGERQGVYFKDRVLRLNVVLPDGRSGMLTYDGRKQTLKFPRKKG